MNITFRQETLDFPSFVRILAHFRPIDKNRSKEPNSPDPINSRINKLKCMFMAFPGKRKELHVTLLLRYLVPVYLMCPLIFSFSS